jgi:hypothetical protein
MTTSLKLLRTIRLDPSDTFVFDRPASAGEWAVPGGFMFLDRDTSSLVGRERQAFRSGFLGLSSFGWSTLAVVVEASPEEYAAAKENLANYLLVAHNAPSLDVALAAAQDELAYASSLADHPIQTLVALHRSLTPEGHFSEQFRTLSSTKPRDDSKMPCSAGAFAIVETDEELDDETINLSSMAARVHVND